MAHLRHKTTGDLKEVTTQSAEYHELAGERDEDGKPVYEDAGVRAHAELGIAPADLSGINDRDTRDYDEMFVEDPTPETVERHGRHIPESKEGEGAPESKYETIDAQGKSDADKAKAEADAKPKAKASA